MIYYTFCRGEPMARILMQGDSPNRPYEISLIFQSTKTFLLQYYEVDYENLPLYLDLGLTFLKLGEEGRVCLKDFSMEGSSRKDFRHIQSKLEREGFAFEIIPSSQVEAILPHLKKISDAWLAEKTTREKGFSLGLYAIFSIPSNTNKNAIISTNCTAINNNHNGISFDFFLSANPAA